MVGEYDSFAQDYDANMYTNFVSMIGESLSNRYLAKHAYKCCPIMTHYLWISVAYSA